MVAVGRDAPSQSCLYYVQPHKVSSIYTYVRSGRQSAETPPSRRQSAETPHLRWWESAETPVFDVEQVVGRDAFR